MAEPPAWLSEPAASARHALGEIAGFLPSIAAAAAFGLLGWLAARLARRGMRHAGDAVNRMTGYLPVRHASLLRLSPTAIRVLGDFAFWLVVFLVLIGVASILELGVVSTWLARLAGFLPAVLAGALIIILGLAASILLGQLTQAAAAPAGHLRSQALGRGVQATVLAVAIVLGIGQTGLDMTLPVALIVVLAASVAGALALAFALGARDLVRDLIGAQGFQQHCELHQRVRIDDLEGEVVDLTATTIVLATSEGRVLVPARIFHERTIRLLAPDTGGDDG
jgi:hypothetical protein